MCIHDCERETRLHEEKQKNNKVNRQDETKFTPTRHYWENMPPEPTQKQRNWRNSSTLNAEKFPKKKLGTSVVWSSILLWRKIPMAWGIPQ